MLSEEAPSEPMMRARAKAIEHEVALFLEVFPLDMTKDGMLPVAWTFCVLRCE